jgi:hypothetical protein
MDCTENETLAEVRTRMLATAGFGDGGYDRPTMRVYFGTWSIVMPNPRGRRIAVQLHDLHHALTGYGTDWRGEGALGGWEIAVGKGRFLLGMALSLGTFAIGMIFFPQTTFAAFVRGRRCNGLFRAYPHGVDAELLSRRIGTMRAELGLDREQPAPVFADRMFCALWLLVALPMLTAHVITGLVLAVPMLVVSAIFSRREKHS